MPIEQQLTNAGTECHLLIQSYHEQLKDRFSHEQYVIQRPVDSSSTKFRLARVLETPYCRQMPLRLGANTLLIFLFGLLHTADGIVTYLGLKFASVVEVNPVLNFFAGFLGLGFSITLLKLGCLVVVTFLYLERHKMKSCWSTTALACAVTFYCWVVSSNVILVVGA